MNRIILIHLGTIKLIPACSLSLTEDMSMVSNRYFRHASGEIYVISQALAEFVSINRSVLFPFSNWFHQVWLYKTWIKFCQLVQQIYSSYVCPWWCECWVLVYWAWCQTYQWREVLLLILVHRSSSVHLCCTILVSPHIYEHDGQWLNMILCFHRSYLCRCLIWFSLRLFGERINPMRTLGFWRLWFALYFIKDWYEEKA